MLIICLAYSTGVRIQTPDSLTPELVLLTYIAHSLPSETMTWSTESLTVVEATTLFGYILYILLYTLQFWKHPAIGNHCFDFCHHRLVLSILYVNGIIQFVVFCV